MKTVNFDCDLCGAMCESEDGVRPINPDWILVSLIPYWPKGSEKQVNTLGLPVSQKDVCSVGCAAKMVEAFLVRLKELAASTPPPAAMAAAAAAMGGVRT